MWPLLLLVMLASASVYLFHTRRMKLGQDILLPTNTSITIWYVVVMPLALMDGWQGWALEWRYMLRSLLMSSAISLLVALATVVALRLNRSMPADSNL